jgi:hypothetical protein
VRLLTGALDTGDNMKTFLTVALACALAGCSTYQAHSNMETPYAATNASHVQILYSPPQRPYTSIGIVSANRYKPGWTDPTVSDAIPQLQAAGAQIGADAVIVRSDRALNDRHVVVEGEAIKFTSAPQLNSRGTIQ